jgi:hypothetical protein
LKKKIEPLRLNPPTGGKRIKKNSADEPDLSISPTLDQVLTFFKTENYSEPEAKKFFNHYQSNGWKIAGKTPMEDWQASAHKWMLNTQNFNAQNKTKPSSTTLNKNKRYDIPL